MVNLNIIFYSVQTHRGLADRCKDIEGAAYMQT